MTHVCGGRSDGRWKMLADAGAMRKEGIEGLDEVALSRLVTKRKWRCTCGRRADAHWRQ